MGATDMLNKTIETSSNVFDTISTKYEEHIRIKAIEKVNEKLILHKLHIDDISTEDYEVMVSEEVSEIKKEYALNTAKIALGMFGLDMIFGL